MDGVLVAAWTGVGLLFITSISTAIGGYIKSNRAHDNKLGDMKAGINKAIGEVKTEVGEMRGEIKFIVKSYDSLDKRTGRLEDRVNGVMDDRKRKE